MFIVIKYKKINVRTYVDLHILSRNGRAIIFGDKYMARKYAKEYQYRGYNYKIVKL